MTSCHIKTFLCPAAHEVCGRIQLLADYHPMLQAADEAAVRNMLRSATVHGQADPIRKALAHQWQAMNVVISAFIAVYENNMLLQ